MIELTYATAVEILDGLVEEFGSEYVYDQGESNRCDYVRDGEPSCIVGHLLNKVGVSIKRLKKADTDEFGGMAAARLLAALRTEGVLTHDAAVPNLLSEAQYRQDHSYSWGESVEMAKIWAQS